MDTDQSVKAREIIINLLYKYIIIYIIIASFI